MSNFKPHLQELLTFLIHLSVRSDLNATLLPTSSVSTGCLSSHGFCLCGRKTPCFMDSCNVHIASLNHYLFLSKCFRIRISGLRTAAQ